jgi:hypothetical protein
MRCIVANQVNAIRAKKLAPKLVTKIAATQQKILARGFKVSTIRFAALQHMSSQRGSLRTRAFQTLLFGEYLC